jgi:NAD(P)-dependent dehydrogenase (short-subunit alcohol dehydrogenase family)
MAGRLQGKVAIISGGATGMGAASARLFAAEGAKVAIIDRNGEEARRTTEAIGKDGGIAGHWLADVSQEDQVKAAAEAAMAEFGPATVLFNHAGSIVIKPFLETTLSDWEGLFAVKCPLHVSDDPRGAAADDRGGRRLDHLHLVDFRGGGDADGSAL